MREGEGDGGPKKLPPRHKTTSINEDGNLTQIKFDANDTFSVDVQTGGLSNYIPANIDEVTRDLLRVRWKWDDDLFPDFGPWIKPPGFDPPMAVKSAMGDTKKSKSRPKQNGCNSDNQLRPKIKESIPEISELTCRKSYSSPIDPNELKRRLTQIIVQKSSKGNTRFYKTLKLNELKPTETKELRMTDQKELIRISNLEKRRMQRNIRCSSKAKQKYEVAQENISAGNPWPGSAPGCGGAGGAHAAGAAGHKETEIENQMNSEPMHLPPVSEITSRNDQLRLNQIRKFPISSISDMNVHFRPLGKYKRHQQPDFSAVRPIPLSEISCMVPDKEIVPNDVRRSSTIKQITNPNLLSIQKFENVKSRARKLGPLNKNIRIECQRSRFT